MALPWKTLDRFETDTETLELRQRGERDFIITLGSQVLMNSMAQGGFSVTCERPGKGGYRHTVFLATKK